MPAVTNLMTQGAVRRDRLAAGGLVVGAFLAAIAAHSPLLYDHFSQLWTKPHYQFFPLAIVGAACLAARASREDLNRPPSAAVFAWLAAAAWFLLAMAAACHSPWLGMVAALAAVMAFAYSLGGGGLVWRGLPALALLSMLVPPPFGQDELLVQSLRNWTVRGSGQCLDLVGILHTRSGNVIELRDSRLLVAEACGGIQSLFAAWAAMLFLALWRRLPLIHTALLLAIATCWVLLANIARIVGVAALADHGIDALAGWRHEAIGMAVFGVAILLTLSANRILQGLFATPPSALGMDDDERPIEAQPIAVAAMPSPTSPTNKIRAVWACLLVGYMAITATHLIAATSDTSAQQVTSSQDLAHLFEESTLRSVWGGWRRLAYSNAPSRVTPRESFTRAWDYGDGIMIARVMVDYPFETWHDLPVCYRAIGWEIDPRQATADDKSLTIVERHLTRGDDRRGLLLFALLDPTGQLAPRPSDSWLAIIGDRLRYALARWSDTAPPTSPYEGAGGLIQVQVFTESYLPIGSGQEQSCRELLAWAIEEVRAALAQDSVERSSQSTSRQPLPPVPAMTTERAR